jgi:hypothetical protein
VPRSAASIQAEIDIREARIASAAGTVQGTAGDGESVNFVNFAEETRRLDQLYQQLDRANGSAPMIARGVVKSL